MYPNSAQSPYPAAAGPGGYPGPMSRRASSRTLPIIAGIGVAVGVFGGLMIIRGTGSSSAANKPEVTELGEKPEGPEVVAAAPPDAAAAGAVVATAAVDAAPKAATPPEPELRKVTMRFDVAPKAAKIEVDGEVVKNGELLLELAPDEKKEVEIKATAEGYEPWSKTVSVAATGATQTVEIELDKVVIRKPVTSSNSGSKKPPRPRDDKPKPRDRGNSRRGGSGGLIDL